MSSFYFSNIVEHPDGAFWSEDNPRFCIRCQVEDRRRRKQAVVTADLRRPEIKFTIPVGYCDEHRSALDEVAA